MSLFTNRLATTDIHVLEKVVSTLFKEQLFGDLDLDQTET